MFDHHLNLIKFIFLICIFKLPTVMPMKLLQHLVIVSICIASAQLRTIIQNYFSIIFALISKKYCVKVKFPLFPLTWLSYTRLLASLEAETYTLLVRYCCAKQLIFAFPLLGHLYRVEYLPK